jgi:hypothetical protein
MNLWPSCHGRAAAAAVALPPPQTEPHPGSGPDSARLSVELPGPPAAPGRVLGAGDNLQSALDDAKPGDVIGLRPGAVFSGLLTLPAKSGDGWITIRTAVPDGAFARPGTRAGPSDAPRMPIIESSSDSAIATDSGAHHYRFIGIEIRPRAGIFVHNLIALGANETSADALPHHILFERCYIHGDPQLGGRRGIALNSRYTGIVDSYISNFKEQGADSQAIAGWNGLGPFAILNNFIEGAGENVLFGGADPTIQNLVPSDIEIRQNLFAKPLSWKVGDPAYGGTPWAVKNLLELKNARRVLVEGNIFEYNWVHAQNGFAILFTPRNQDGGAPWSMVQDVTFINNIVRHTASAVNIAGTDDNFPSQQTKHILIRGNVFEDIDGAKWGGGSGRLFQLLAGTDDVTIDHNTAFQTGDAIGEEGTAHSQFVYTNNLTPNNQYGVGGTNTYGNPMLTISRSFPGAIFAKNVLQGGNSSAYPPNNFFPSAMADIRFVDLSGGNYRLLNKSPFKNAGTDKKDIGADIDVLQAAIMAPRTRLPAIRRASN